MLEQVVCDNRPFVRVNLFGRTVVGLLDSGANVSIIGRKGLHLTESLSVESREDEVKEVLTADGVGQTCIGSVNIPVSLDQCVKLIRIMIVPSIEHELILGSDFFRAFKLKLDLSSQSYEVGDVQVSALESSQKDNTDGVQARCELSVNQEKQLKNVVQQYEELSWKQGTRLGRTHLVEHKIDTGDAEPFITRPHHMSPYMLDKLHEELDKMLKLGVVRPSRSSWASPIVMVRKSNNEVRFCFDGRRLNSVTKRDAYPLPRVDAILQKLSGARYLSSIDLKSAFWQIPLEKSSCEKTAFVVPGRGLYEFVVTPFGLVNAPQEQQRLMDKLFGFDFDDVFVYLDDAIIVSKTFQEHLSSLDRVFRRLKEAGLSINFDKCEFCKDSLKYLGFVVDRVGLRTDPEKIKAMLEYPRPKTATEIKRFLGITSWYRRFIKDFASLTAPISALTKKKKKGAKVEWNSEAEEAFVQIKESLIQAPILNSPDFSKEFIIQCDASSVGLGCVLTQVSRDGQETPVAYASRTLTDVEKKYSVTEKECAAVLFGIEKFRGFVEGIRFKVITDHASLKWLHSIQSPSGRLSRWAMRLQQYDMLVEHRKGSKNVVPDALSRAPMEAMVISVSDDQWFIGLMRAVTYEPEKFPDFRIEDDDLYKHIPLKHNLETNISPWKKVVRQEGREEIIRKCHDDPTSAHLGSSKTYARLQECYYWPKMKEDVSRYVKSCEVCSMQKVPPEARKGLMGQEKNVSYPWQVISCDIIGPLPRSTQGHKYLLVVNDWFSKFTLLFPLREAKAPKIAKFLEEQVFLMFGVPQILMCDNGTEFSNVILRSLATKYGVKIWYNAKYHAQVNPTERTNRTIGAAIRSYLKDNQHNHWDAHLSEIGFALRTACHDVLKVSPSFLNFGRYVPISGEFYGKAQELGTDNMEERIEQYGIEMSKLASIVKDIKQRLHTAYLKNEKYYNKTKKDSPVYKVNEFVWKRQYVLSNAALKFASKLAPRYLKAKVSQRISDLVYELEDEKGKSLGRWHVKDLKPYVERDSS